LLVQLLLLTCEFPHARRNCLRPCSGPIFGPFSALYAWLKTAVRSCRVARASAGRPAARFKITSQPDRW
jgi:hypothetical protein